MSGELVLVTGGSGFLGAHCILELLKAGYRVRTTVRSAKREADVLAMLRDGGAEPGEALSFASCRSDDRCRLARSGRRMRRMFFMSPRRFRPVCPSMKTT